MERLDIDELADFFVLDPGEEFRDGAVIRHPGIFVPDGRGEELQKASCNVVAGGGDGGRHGDAAGRLDGRLAGPKSGRADSWHILHTEPRGAGLTPTTGPTRP